MRSVLERLRRDARFGSGEVVAWAVLLLVLAQVLSFVVLSPPERLADKPFLDDSYYVFTVARNIARGQGIVYNFGVPTNGVQPLILIPYALIWKATEMLGWDKYAPLRLLDLMNLFLLGLSAVMARKLVKRLGLGIGLDETTVNFASILILLLAFVNINIVRTYLNGLETGLYSLLILSFLLLLAPYRDLAGMSNFRVCFAGVLGGLCILARVDFPIILLILLLIAGLRNRADLGKAISIGAIASLVASPWFLYNYFGFGAIVPSSGAAESIQPDLLSNILATVIALANQALAIFWLPAGWFDSLETIALVCRLLAVSVLFLFIGRPLRSCIKWPLDAFLISYGFLIAVYTVFITTNFFFERYFAPAFLVWLSLLAVSLSASLRRIHFLRRERLLGGLAVVMLFVYTAFVGYTLYRGSQDNVFVYTIKWLDQNVSVDSKVGAFQSGTIGYFREDTFNLDGKMDPEALKHELNHTLECYILERGISYVVDWPSHLLGLDPQFLKARTSTVASIAESSSVVLRIDDPSPYPPCEGNSP